MSKVRLSKSVVGEDERAALVRVIEAGYLGMGVEVQHFEQEIQQFLETERDVVCVNTGTSALHLSLQALGIGLGDEVLVPSLTYVATFQAISATGAKAVACDVTESTAFIDLNDAAKRINRHTKAIIPVHYGSNYNGMLSVYKFAEKHGLRVVEDAAHSFGCSDQGKRIGSIGDITCFSFDGIKNITSGEGGAVVTNDGQVAQKIKDARLLGVEQDTEKRYAKQRSWNFDVSEQGWRYHMSNLMAAIGREQLKKIDYFSTKRKSIAKRYMSELNGITGLKLMDFDYDEIVPHIFPIRVLGGDRDNLAEVLFQNGIETGIHYQPNHQLSYYQSDYSLPVTEMLCRELLSIPLHPEVTDEDQNRIINIIKYSLVQR